MKKPRFKLAIAYFDNGTERDADIFAVDTTKDSDAQYRKYAKRRYGHDVRLEDVFVYDRPDIWYVSDAAGKREFKVRLDEIID